MAHHVETDISVKGFGFTSDEGGKRLHFPHAVSHDVAGRVGGVAYGGADVLFDGLEGRLDTLRWTAEAASVGRAWLRDDAGRVDVEVDRIEMSRGLMLTRADRGVEIVSPHVSFSEMKLTLQGPFGAARTEDAAAAEAVAVTSATGSKPTLAASTREPKPDLAASTREPIEVRRAVTVDANAAKIRDLLRRPEAWLKGGVVESVASEPGRWRLALCALGYDVGELEFAVSEESDGLRLSARSGADGTGGAYHGRVRLVPAPDQIGMEVHAALRIEPASALTAALARAIDGVAARALGHALHRLRQLVETGEIARSDLQPHGRRGLVARAAKAAARRSEAAA